MPFVRPAPGYRGRTPFALALLLVAFVSWLAPSAEAADRTVTHRIDFDANALRLEKEAEGTRVTYEGASTLGLPARPDLPVVGSHWVVPQGLRASGIRVAVDEWVDLGPAKQLLGPAPLVDEEGNAVAASFDPRRADWTVGAGSAFPPVAAEVTGTQGLRGWSVASVEFFPVRVSEDGRLQRAVAATFELELEIDPASNDRVRRRIAWPGLRERDARIVQLTVENPEDVRTMEPPRGLDPAVAEIDFAGLEGARAKVPRVVDGPVDYIILTNDTFAPHFQPLADRRTEEGLNTYVVTVDQVTANYRPGSDLQETLRGFLRHAHEEWGTSYLLLAGDAEILPPRYARSIFYPVGSYTDIPSDLYFAALDGNWNADSDGVHGEAFQSFAETGDDVDLLAELAIGRAPVKNVTHVQTFVNKTLEYTEPGDPSYLGRALFLSEVLFPQNWDGVSSPTLDGALYSENIIFNSIIGGGNLMQSWRMYENYPAYIGAIEETKVAAMDSMQTGNFGLVNHVGHGFYYNMSVGDGNVFVADVDILTNAPNYFFLYALNCSSGAFDFDCLLERYLQNPNGGAVGAVGSSRAAFPTAADVYQQDFYAEIFQNKVERVGDAQLISRSANSANTNFEGSHRWTHYTYHLFADPTLRIWREEPTVLAATHPGAITLGDADVLVDVGAVQGAAVTLSRADGGMVTGLTDGAGQVTLSLTGISDRVGSAQLDVSGANLLPYRTTLPVQVGVGAHVNASAESIDDGAVAPSAGDGDGLVDAGETVQWAFRFENDGDGTLAPSVSAQLVPTSASGATLVDDTVVVGDIAGSVSTVASQTFVIDVDPLVPDGTRMQFDLVITSGGDTWTEAVEFTVLAPQVEVTRVYWDDSVLGNGDGILEDGETFDLFVELVNYGAGTSNVLTGLLTTGSGNVTLIDDTAVWNDFGEMQFGEGDAPFRLIESMVAVENGIFLYLSDDQGRSWTHEFELRPPLAPPAPVTDTSFGPDRIALRLDSPVEPKFFGYRVFRATDPGGPFVEVTQDRIVDTGFYMDSGLASLTRYYYQVATVDSSMVMSDFSPQAEASTSPPELAGGFPLPFERELAGAVAVGDMRGDGTKVVAYGSDWIYTIDSNGQELLDGDFDSQTLGPLGGDPNAKRWTPSGVSLVDLDGDGADEVIAANWDNNQIWILRGDGTNFPGWPQTMNGRSWATPSVGDLDNDGDYEIVVNNVVGRTYVWHHDGTDFFDGDGDPGTVGVFQVRSGENFNRSTPALFDVDGDGTLELLFGTHFRSGVDNFFYALKNDGTNAPGWPKNLGPNGYSVGHATVADLDGDGTHEIVHVNDDDMMYVWEPDGSDFPNFPMPFMTQSANVDSKTPAVAFGDFDRDRDLEMVAVSIQTAKKCLVYLMDHDGTVRPGWPRELPGLSESSPLIADINGDLQLDIVFGIGGGSDNEPNVLYAMNMDATDVQGFPITLPGAVRAVPAIDDFDLDGDVDVVYAGFDRFLHVWDMPFDYHAYLSPWTTFQGNNRRTGVFLEDRITSAITAQIVLRTSARGVVVESSFVGAASIDVAFDLERREAGAGESAWQRIAEGLAVDGTTLVYVDGTARSGSTYEYRLVDENDAMVFFSEPLLVPALAAKLHPATPNPFNPKTTLRFEVPGTAGALVPTRLVVYDLAGRRVRVLQSEPLAPGTHVVEWNGLDDGGAFVGSGVYFARLSCAGEERSLKMTLVK